MNSVMEQTTQTPIEIMMKQLVKDEIKHLGVNSPEFIKRHNEIMADIENAQQQERG